MPERKRQRRIYVDTSVFGGVYDHEFSGPSEKLMEHIRIGIFTLVTSVLVEKEIKQAPPEMWDLFDKMLEMAEYTEIDKEAILLQ